MVFAGRSRQKAREDTLEARRIRASKLAHERGDINKAVSALISPAAAPRDSRTLATLRSKYPTEETQQRLQQVPVQYYTPVLRGQILRLERGKGNNNFPCSADHERDWLPFPGDPYSAESADYTYIHIYCGPYSVTIHWRIQLNPMKSFCHYYSRCSHYLNVLTPPSLIGQILRIRGLDTFRYFFTLEVFDKTPSPQEG